MDKIIESLTGANHAVVAKGNVFDYHLEPNKMDIFYRPNYHADYFYNSEFVVIRYSRSSGLIIYRHDETIKKYPQLKELLNSSNLNGFLNKASIDSSEVVTIFRIFKMMMVKNHEVPITLILDFSEHLISKQSPTIETQIVEESLTEIVYLPSSIKSGNKLLLYANSVHDFPTLLAAVPQVDYQFPDISVYEQFLTIMAGRNEFAKCENDLSETARSLKGLTLSNVASIFKNAKSQNLTVGVNTILKEKQTLIEQISEGTLTLLPRHVTFDDMAGIERTKGILLGFSGQLRDGDINSPRGILLVGPPGTGKTTIASAIAQSCGWNLLELSDSIKDQYVGNSERRLELALSLVRSMSPVILFIDEIDQAFSNRSSSSLDGGVSQHYLKTIFKFTADDSMRGKVLIVGASNTPHLLDPALLSRFVTIPVLENSPEQIAAIFPKIERRLFGSESLKPNSPVLLEASKILYKKGASPRQIFDVINHSLLQKGSINETAILESSKSFRFNGDPYSSAYSSLVAIRQTAFEEYLPWYGNKNYPVPAYLEGILDSETGVLDDIKLNQRIEEYSKYARY